MHRLPERGDVTAAAADARIAGDLGFEVTVAAAP
jgi:hypothetical protein